MTLKPIPDDILIPAVNLTLREFPGPCVDNWGEKQRAVCREKCGPEYEIIETDWIGKRAINLRKAGKLDSINGGAKRKKWTEPTGKYAEYLLSEHWQVFRRIVMDFWGGRCCLCLSRAVDVHHNTYIRLGCEELTDCVALCRSCHMKVHGAMADGNHVLNSDEGLFG
tara:strand:+ start:927 stop:1427 length:501 start_codon:yes stop_codon:yes gene_type:complete